MGAPGAPGFEMLLHQSALVGLDSLISEIRPIF
jgi:hypothetical protein